MRLLKLLPYLQSLSFIFLKLMFATDLHQDAFFLIYICIKLYVVYMRKCDIDICIIEHHHKSLSR
jgi:hypothetical protein